ncbi:hypothetical protein VAMP_6n29 [Candidatus Vampirococcus lugosii]|uniref:Uncharacterized protein n=2 Tax=Candidatus Vampirococcus lugosii TaxID=2789015 RepID=A0ABS5QL60_9BACT|nr:hypothetical protein [Candidatus Vampirococcus lugosii]
MFSREKIINCLKNNWKKILLFILLIIFGFCFHVFVLIAGSIVYFTYFSAFLFLIFSFSIFKKFYKTLFYFILFLVISQILILLISFPKCSYNFKYPMYSCKCLGVKKQELFGTQCIGKIKECYDYLKNSNIGKEESLELSYEDKYHSEFKVSCDNFPDKLMK